MRYHPFIARKIEEMRATAENYKELRARLAAATIVMIHLYPEFRHPDYIEARLIQKITVKQLCR